MEQYTDNQYDDDLTIGAEEFGDTFQTSDIDLFEFGGDEESPISRLKTLVLSIDWEITDDVLIQFNEELVDLKDIWVDDKVRMVYLQALEKISRYIYRDKSDAHPNAIKLLLGMYYNLEKIVSTDDISEREIKRLLSKDVRKFEKLKAQIGQTEGRGSEVPEAAPAERPAREDDFDPDLDDHELIDLKALVLAIDWEITEKDLLELREEVMRLEGKYSDSKPKLVFLQGIGTLATYILKKKSNAHADAFTLLHSFYDGLEKIVRTPMSLAEEKAVLFPEVDKFNAFKKIIASTIAPGTRESSEEDEDGPDYSGGGDVAPAFAEMPEDETRGFQEEAEAASLNAEVPLQVDDHVNKFFGEDEEQPVSPVEEPGGGFGSGNVEEEAAALSDAFFSGVGETESSTLEIDKETALKGVDVETEADDDSDEEALPEFNGEIAPALADSLGSSSFGEDQLEKVAVEPEEDISDEISGKLDTFFVDTEGVKEPGAEEIPEVSAEVALQGVDVETEADEEDEDTPPLPEEPFAGEEMEHSEFAVTDDTAAEEAPVAALFDTVFEGEAEEPETEVEPAAALGDVDEMGEEDFVFDDTLPEGGLFGDDDTTLEASLDEALTAPVDEEELASALGGYEEEQEAEDFQAVPAALTHVDESDESLEGGTAAVETEEAEVAERFDALFGEAEPAAAGDVTEEPPVSAEAALQGVDVETEDDEEETAAEEVKPALAGAVSAAAVAAAAGSLAEEDEEDEYAAVFTAAEEEEAAAAEEAEEPVEAEPFEEEILAPLKECVHSLALEIDDAVVQGLFKEINSLRQQWAEKPLEKSYLQLLSTVAQHIEQYRYEASAESHGLLEKLAGNLESSQSISVEEAQENLLADTYQILQWQQNMLSRQAVSRGGQLTFLDPVRAESEEDESQAKVELSDDTFADDFAAELESAMTDNEDSDQENVEELLEDEIDTFIPEGDETVDLDLEEALTMEVEQAKRSLAGTPGEDGMITEVVRQEIDSLRKLLQEEIAELRSAIKGDSE